MGLLNPAALFFLALLPLLALAYMVRERPSRVVVSSVNAFRALRGLKAERPWGGLRFSWLLLLELLILVLAVLALAGPYLSRRRRPIAVVLDNSAMMQAQTTAGPTRFETARTRLAEALAREPGDAAVTLYVTTPEATELSASRSVAAARSLIDRVTPSDAPLEPAAVGRLISSLVANRRFEEILVATAHPLVDPPPSQVHLYEVGEPIANLAFGGFTLRRERLGANELKARLTVANFGNQAQTVTVTLGGDGKTLGRAQAKLEPREVGAVEFPTLSAAVTYQAQLNPADGFGLDNVAYAAAGGSQQIQILFVSPTPGDATGLSSLPGISVTTVSPEAFSPATAKADLIIFQYAVPKELPPANVLLVMPPGGDPVFDFTVRPAPADQVSDWRSPDPLTDEVNFRLLDLRQAEVFGEHPWMEPVAEGPHGNLMIVGSRQGHRYVATGFNPFPYLGRQNLPMSVLTLNIISYLGGLGAEEAGYRTGEPWIVPAGVTRVVSPNGATYSVAPGTLFAGDTVQGIYRLEGEGIEPRRRAVNLNDLAESDLADPAPIKLELQAANAPEARGFIQRMPLAAYLLSAILALAALEMLLAYRRRRRMVEVEQ